MFALSLLLALASAAIVTAQAPTPPPQPVFPPACATLSQITVSSFGTPNNTLTTTEGVVSFDVDGNGFQLMRVDTLTPPLPGGEQSLTTFIQLGPKQQAIISNYLNGTVTCFTTSGSTNTPPSTFTFVGVETNSGVKANHW
jgi:hypothetical protein